jgi:hypothetical protein
MAQMLFRNVRGSRRKAAIQDLNSIARKELEKTIDAKVKPALIKSHEIVVANWEHKPKFQSRKFIRPERIAVNVFPTGENAKIWRFVDEGTRPHLMPEVTGKLMVFQAGGRYISKTLAKPARTVSGGGKVTGGTKVITMKRKAFTHPGNEPRNFTKQIAEDIQPSYRKEIENAFRRASNKTKE